MCLLGIGSFQRHQEIAGVLFPNRRLVKKFQITFSLSQQRCGCRGQRSQAGSSAQELGGDSYKQIVMVGGSVDELTICELLIICPTHSPGSSAVISCSGVATIKDGLRRRYQTLRRSHD